MTPWLLTHARASDTAAKPPSTTSTTRRPGSPRRICLIMCRTQSTLVWCRDWSFCFTGRQRAVRKGIAQTRRAQGTGTRSIIDTHVRPNQWMTCFLVERTASREQPWAVILRPLRRSTGSSARTTTVAPAGTKHVMSTPSRI